MISLDEFRALKASGKWEGKTRASLPLANMGVACPQCGTELQTDSTEVGDQEPAQYNFRCPSCGFTVVV